MSRLQDKAAHGLVRRTLLQAGMGIGMAVLGPRLPQAQITTMAPPTSLFEGVRHLLIGASMLVSDGNDQNWRGLAPQLMSGRPPQALAGGLFPNDLDGDPTTSPPKPSLIDTRVGEFARRLLESSERRSPSAMRPRLLRGLSDIQSVQQSDLDDAMNVVVQLYIRDISDDLLTPPPRRVASVLLVRIISYRRRTTSPDYWASGPSVSVDTVVRSDSTAWLLAKVDAGVADALSPWAAI
ncbi:hypothetical protein [Falsiroseomonas sp. HW251]|uniref:hypothetical protein n=1 Tax=Falsiroseomonas sp. HW251 TaxID=3390998 RepID=UPI003D31983B